MKLNQNFYAAPEDMLFALGNQKAAGEEISWEEIADTVNAAFGTEHTESWFRKRYKQMAKQTAEYVPPIIMDTELSARNKIALLEMEKQRMRVSKEHAAYKSTLRKEMTRDAFLEELQAAIERAEPVNTAKRARPQGKRQRVVYAMLGDIHYGIAFSHFYGAYDTNVAKERVMRYADEIIRIGGEAGASDCVVTLMGDLISGCSHKTIRLENTENMAQQIVGVSELISAFLLRLSEAFSTVSVNAVDGNHSRLEPTAEDAMRKERLDRLIPWYCKAKLENIENILFRENTYDATIADVTLFGKLFLAVHGDFDAMNQDAVTRIQNMIGRKVDYFLLGHKHVPEMRMEDTTMIRNGAVLTGGDDYTAKKRLFGPAAQVCMVVGNSGVESVHTVRLSGDDEHGSD